MVAARDERERDGRGSRGRVRPIERHLDAAAPGRGHLRQTRARREGRCRGCRRRPQDGGDHDGAQHGRTPAVSHVLPPSRGSVDVRERRTSVRFQPTNLSRPSTQCKSGRRASSPSGRRVGQVAADVADVDAARHLARAVGDVEVDARDEAGARARAERDVRAEVEARAVVGDDVVLGVAGAGELGDVRRARSARAEAAAWPSEVPKPDGSAYSAAEAVERSSASRISAGRRYGLSAADSNADAREDEVLEVARRRRSTASSTDFGGRRRPRRPRRRASARPPASPSAALRRGDRLAVALGRLARAPRPGAAGPRGARGRPRARRAAPRARPATRRTARRRRPGRGLARPPARRSARRSSARAARASASRDLALRRVARARLLVALASASSRRRRASSTWRRRSSARCCSRSSLPLARLDVARLALGVAQAREQRRVGRARAAVEELLPRAEDLDDRRRGAAMSSRLQPVAARSAARPSSSDPAVEVAEVVGLLDEQRDLAQARVGERAAGAPRAGGAPRASAAAVGRRAGAVGVAVRRPPSAGPCAASACPRSRRGRRRRATSRGSRRETTFETPSSPIDTP